MIPPRLPMAIDTRRVRSLDGTEIAYHVTPAPRDPNAPWIVLANGLGGNYLSFRGPIEYLGDRYRFLTWDYRGLYASKRPTPDDARGYAIPNHVRDLAAILDAERVERASLVGWSMGVQVALEAFQTMRGRIRNLVLMNGTAGRPLDTVAPIPGMGAVLTPLLDLARLAHPIATKMARHTTAQPETVFWFKRLGLLGRSFDDAVFAELVQAFAELDMEPFFRNLRAIGDHDARAVLPHVDVPTLVITGDRDLFTPRTLAQQMARRIPEAELLVVRGGTHYTAVEYPELISLRLERFFREHGF
jgi:pimeloyl-ACP methyl ester carboxylesterase